MNDRTESPAPRSHETSAALPADTDQPTSLPGAEPDSRSDASSAAAAPLQEALTDHPQTLGATAKRADTTPARPAASKTKSQHVRDFLRQHPEARNRDIAEALAAYGVTAADVANVKSQLKRQQDAPPKAQRRGRPAAQSASAPASDAPRAVASTAAEDNLSLSDLEQAIAFVKQLGGFQRARQAIDLLEQIRQIKP